MPPDVRCIRGVADSKAVKREHRPILAAEITQQAIAVSLGAASVREIDVLNIYQATVLAMRRALTRLHVTPDHVVIDGKPMRTLEIPHIAIVDGDALCYSVACASIVAKVTRDRLMASLGRRYPAYLWERNAGYGTPAHLDALATAGVTIHHRKSFAPVQCLIR
jgi:ribonuclease HII